MLQKTKNQNKTQNRDFGCRKWNCDKTSVCEKKSTKQSNLEFEASASTLCYRTRNQALLLLARRNFKLPIEFCFIRFDA